MDEPETPEYRPKKKGQRVSLKDISKKSKKVNKGGTSFNLSLEGVEVEIKNDKGSPLPVSLPSKLVNKIDNISSLLGQPKFEVDDKRMSEDLDAVKKNLELIQSILKTNKDKIKANDMSEKIELTLKFLKESIKSGDANRIKESIKRSAEDVKESNKLIDSTENLSFSVSEALDATLRILNSDASSSRSQIEASHNMLSILKENGYSDTKKMEELITAVKFGNDKQAKIILKSINLDSENFKDNKISNKRTIKVLEGVETLNKDMLEEMEHKNIQDMFANKFKKTSAFSKSDTAKGSLGLITSMLGIPGAEILAGPLMDVGNAIGGKNIMKGLRSLNPLKSGGKGPLGLGMKYGGKAMRGGGIAGGVLSTAATGFEEYQKYQTAKESGASEKELSNIKTTGIAKTVGSGIGGAAGAALGSLLGPIGTMAGGYLGSIAGEWLGEKAGDFINEGGISKLTDAVTGYFSDLGDSFSYVFDASIDGVKSVFKSISGFVSDLFSDDGMFGSLNNFLKTIFDLSPIGMIVNNFDAITEGIDGMFGEKGIFSIAQKYINKILDSAPIKALMSVFNGNLVTSVGASVGGALSDLFNSNELPEVQKSNPTMSLREMDVKSADLDKRELEMQRTSRKETSPITQISTPAVPAQQPQASMNSRPVIDDYGIAFMNSAVFE